MTLPFLAAALLPLPWCRAVALCLALAGCASTPPLVAAAAAQPVSIEGAKGPVSPERSRQIVERLKAEPGPDGILDRHLKIESAVTGSPLVAGNSVTLLQDGEATYQSMFEAIAHAKGEIYAGLGADGIALVNADEPFAAYWRGLNAGRAGYSNSSACVPARTNTTKPCLAVSSSR